MKFESEYFKGNVKLISSTGRILTIKYPMYRWSHWEEGKFRKVESFFPDIWAKREWTPHPHYIAKRFL